MSIFYSARKVLTPIVESGMVSVLGKERESVKSGA